jgi:hypothetical protein
MFYANPEPYIDGVKELIAEESGEAEESDGTADELAVQPINNEVSGIVVALVIASLGTIGVVFRGRMMEVLIKNKKPIPVHIHNTHELRNTIYEGTAMALKTVEAERWHLLSVTKFGGKLEPEMFKKLVSGEPVEAHRKYKDPYMMTRYARLMFNCNVLPRDVELTDGFFRRLLIIPFQVTIPEKDQIKDLAKQIIATELSGVFNWVLTGLNRLLQNKRFTHSPIVKELVKQYRIESDSVAMFLQEKMIRPGTSKRLLLQDLYEEYAKFCKNNGYHAASNRTFASRLRGFGFKDRRIDEGTAFFCDRGHGYQFTKEPVSQPNAETDAK